MHYTYHYVIDWDKVKTLDDMKRLIAAIEISFMPDNRHLENIMDLVAREDKSSEFGLSLTNTVITP